MKNYRIVILDNPYASWDSPFVRDLFEKIISVKKRGFQSRFSYKYAPVDKSDFHGIHALLCKEVNGELFPMMISRYIEKNRCERYGMPFPGETLCDNTGSDKHIKAVKEFVNNNEGHNIAYASAFAIEPNLEKEERKAAIEFLFPIYSYVHIHFGITRGLAIGSCKTHTDTMYHNLGLGPIQIDGETLAPVRFPCNANEMFEVQTFEKLTPFCIEKANEFIGFWNNRIHVADASVGNEIVEEYLISAGSITKMSA